MIPMTTYQNLSAKNVFNMAMDWEKLKKRASLYEIKCCPSCGNENLSEYAEGILGPRWSCKCGVNFEVRNPSALRRKPKKSKPSTEQHGGT
jgi:transposase-like protein